MNPVESALRVVDAAQRRNRPVAFLVAVVKKFGDDRGPALAALLAFYGFLSLFPALLVLVTVVGFFGNDSAAHDVVGSVLGGLPVFGDRIGEDATRPLEGSLFGLAAGLLFLVWGSLGVAQAGQHAMAQIWNVPGNVRPGFFPRLLRGLGFGVLMATGIVVIATVGTAGTLGSGSVPARVASLLFQCGLTIGLYLAAFRVLTPKSVPTAHLVAGSVVGGIGYSLLQLAGTALVRHQLRGSEPLFGQFALVLGLLAWLHLIAQVSLYGAETNVVLRRRLWPRSILQPPLTDADERVFTDIARQERRRPEQRVRVDFDERDRTDDVAS